MTISAFRLTQTKYANTAFDGEGAKLNGGRWNSVGTRMVYTASSLSLATLELIVNIDDISILYGHYSVIPIQFHDSLVERLADGSLPRGWDSPEPIADTQILGDNWIKKGTSAILEVPSVVTKTEKNILLNPAHPDFPSVTIGKSFPFQPDDRLKDSD